MMEQVYGQDLYLGNVKNTGDTLSKISINIILMKIVICKLFMSFVEFGR
jgi:hypothetical protein